MGKQWEDRDHHGAEQHDERNRCEDFLLFGLYDAVGCGDRRRPADREATRDQDPLRPGDAHELAGEHRPRDTQNDNRCYQNDHTRAEREDGAQHQLQSE